MSIPFLISWFNILLQISIRHRCTSIPHSNMPIVRIIIKIESVIVKASELLELVEAFNPEAIINQGRCPTRRRDKLTNRLLLPWNSDIIYST